MQIQHAAVAILPSSNLDRSEAFYNRLGFFRETGEQPDWVSLYRILHDAHGASIHLVNGGEDLLEPERNPAGLYLYIEDVDRLAVEFGDEVLEKRNRPENKLWGMYEFSLSDPDGALVGSAGRHDCAGKANRRASPPRRTACRAASAGPPATDSRRPPLTPYAACSV